MLTIAFKTLRSNLSRFVATLIAIATGVGFLTAGTMVTNSIENSLGGEVDRQYAAVSTAVELKGADTERGLQRGGIPLDELAKVRAVDGVRAVAGEITGTTRLASGDTETDKTFDRGVAVRIWTTDDSLNPLTLDEGAAPNAANEVTIDRGFAADKHIRLGDRVNLATATGPQRARVVGITSFGTTDAPDAGGTITAAEPWAFDLAGIATPAYSQILVAGDPDVSEATLVRRVDAVLDKGFHAISGDKFRENAKGDSAAILGVLRPVLQGFSGLALFVCGFVIFNTFSVVVGQRVRELALMRAVAATPRQIRRSLRVEGIGVGLLGSILGLGLGALITFILAQVLEALDLDLPKAEITMTPAIVIVGLLVGTLLTFVSVLIPAFRAGRTAPIEAMREAAVEPGKVSKFRLITALVLLGLGIIGMITEISWFLAIGALFFLVGVFLLGPALAFWTARATRPVFAALGMAGRLSSDNIARNPKRTATTMNALVIGLLLVTLVTVAGNSLKKTTVAEVNKYSSADFLVGARTGSIDSKLLDKIERLDGVTAMARLRSFPVRIDDHPDSLTSVDPKDLKAIGIKTEQGSLAKLGDGVAVANFQGTAKIGDVNVFTDALGNRIRLKTTAVLAFSIDAFSLGSVVSPETLAKYAPDAGETGALLKVDSSKLSSVSRQIKKLTIGFANVQVAEGNIFGRVIESIFNFLINAVNGLLGMSIVIALIGIVNTLTLSIFERRRELGLLRAVGMTSQSVKRMIRLEALQMSVLGTVIGMLAGTLLAWLLLRASDLGKLEIQWGRIGILFGIGVLIGIVASIAPTRRVTKLNVLEAIEVT